MWETNENLTFALMKLMWEEDQSAKAENKVVAFVLSKMPYELALTIAEKLEDA